MEILESIGAILLKASVVRMMHSIELSLVTFAAVGILIALFALPLAGLPLLLPLPTEVNISNTPGELLPTETICRDDNKFSSLATVRHETDFDLQKALDEYSATPVIYTLRLAKIDVELRAVLHEREPVLYEQAKKRQSMSRRRRARALESSPGDAKHISLLEKIFWWWSELQWKAVEDGTCLKCGLLHPERNDLPQPEKGGGVVQTNWLKEMHNFEWNIFQLCFRIGVEVEKFASAKECIKVLRLHTMKQRRELEPLFQDRARLIQELERYKRFNAALQVRRTIEKLGAEYAKHRSLNRPGTTTYTWSRFWNEVWENAAENSRNPFYKLRQSRGHELTNAGTKGEQLFADMSAEIHQYDRVRHEYEHFHPSTQAIIKILLPATEGGNDEVDWEEQLRRFV